jgi:hypothetical protein
MGVGQTQEGIAGRILSTTTKHGGVGLKQKPNDQALWRASQY